MLPRNIDLAREEREGFRWMLAPDGSSVRLPTPHQCQLCTEDAVYYAVELASTNPHFCTVHWQAYWNSHEASRAIQTPCNP